MSQHDPAAETAETAETGETGSPVTVYWRPGCGFCGSLLRRLDAAGLVHQRRNIWEDEEAGALVRGLADGNETVPTVVIGPVGLVNPTADDVLAEVAEVAPEWLPDGHAPRPGTVARSVRRSRAEPGA